METVSATKNDDKAELTLDIADLSYQLLVLMQAKDVSLSDLCTELVRRHNK